jgi:hypothetical protein
MLEFCMLVSQYQSSTGFNMEEWTCSPPKFYGSVSVVEYRLELEREGSTSSSWMRMPYILGDLAVCPTTQSCSPNLRAFQDNQRQTLTAALILLWCLHPPDPWLSMQIWMTNSAGRQQLARSWLMLEKLRPVVTSKFLSSRSLADQQPTLHC